MGPAHKRQKLSSDGTAITTVTADSATSTPKAEAGTSTTASTTDQQNRSLFVRSLPTTTTSESLTELFSDSYPIKHATAVLDKETKLCRGFGFVTFADAEDAQRAREEFNGYLYQGKKLRVEVAEKRNREAGKADGEGAKIPSAAAAANDADHLKTTTNLELKGSDETAAASANQASPTKKGRHAQEFPVQQSRLIVRNLPWTIKNSDQLAKLFLSYGKVKQAYIPKKGPGLLAGFGFVVLRGRKNAEKALEGVNGKEVDGRTLAVDWALTKDDYENALKEEQEKEKAEKKATTAGKGEDIRPDEDEDEDEDDGVRLDGASDYDEDDLDELEDDDDEDDDDDDVDVDDLGGEDDDDEEEDEELARRNQTEDRSSTLFIRNLPFTCDDEGLEDFFTKFGAIRYARVVMDFGTERSKGTGFVCFYNKEEADECLRSAPRKAVPTAAEEARGKFANNSILQNEDTDPTGQYTLDGRVLQLARAVDKNEASRLTEEGSAYRSKRDKDKRNLFLLSEGTIPSNSKLWEQLPPSERTMREASAKQRKQLIESNPSLHLSLTRLSIRNIPRSVDSRELKALAREAVVGFAKDVKEGKRERLSKEEVARGGDEMVEAEKARKQAGKGLVKQAKVVFEGQGGSKVSESSGAGRSRGYGFIEYHTHRSALMGLRWLNGHAIGYQVKETSGKKLSSEEVQDRKKRLIVEFAIENAQVVLRRKDRETKARERSKAVVEGRVKSLSEPRAKTANPGKKFARDRETAKANGRKRKRGAADDAAPVAAAESRAKRPADEKLAKRNQIIGRKRAMRKARKGGK